jgi:hypothetical protein
MVRFRSFRVLLAYNALVVYTYASTLRRGGP